MNDQHDGDAGTEPPKGYVSYDSAAAQSPRAVSNPPLVIAGVMAILEGLGSGLLAAIGVWIALTDDGRSILGREFGWFLAIWFGAFAAVFLISGIAAARRAAWGATMLIVVYGILDVLLLIATINADQSDRSVVFWLAWHALVLVLAIVGRIRAATA